MSWLFSAVEELLPAIVFFVGVKWYSFSLGVIAMVVVLLLLLVFSFVLGRKVPRFALVSTIALLFFAIPSIVLNDPVWFQISDTVLDGAFSLLLLGSYIVRYPILKVFFDRVFAISDHAWNILSWRWGMFFLVLATLNEYVRLSYSPEVWSYFKLAASIAIPLFGCYQFTLSVRERIVGESNWLGLRTSNTQ